MPPELNWSLTTLTQPSDAPSLFGREPLVVDVVARTGLVVLVVFRGRLVVVGWEVVLGGSVVGAADVSTAPCAVDFGCPDPMAPGTETSRPARLAAQVATMILRRGPGLCRRRWFPAMVDPPHTRRRKTRNRRREQIPRGLGEPTRWPRFYHESLDAAKRPPGCRNALRFQGGTSSALMDR
jgi:hypothetical protein